MLKRLFNSLQKNLLFQRLVIRVDMDPIEKGEKRSAEDEDVGTSESGKKQKTQGNPDRKRKCAIMFGYNGKGYHGLQRNPGFKTLEEELCKALLKAELIPVEHFEYMQKMLMNKENLIDVINSHLPAQVKVFDCLRTTQSFNSKNFCDARTYIYLVPTYAFLHKDKALTTEFKMDANLLEQVNEVLEKFRGTHNFHNYTSGLSAEQQSASRFIIDFECRHPFVRHGVEFCEISVKGQSFMMHQIRKMVGTVIAVIKGYVESGFIEDSFKHDRICLPKAPGLGLVLDKLHYDMYNKRFGSDHKKIDFQALKDKIQPFKEEVILSDIYKTEVEEYSMLKWLPELEMFTFEIEKQNERLHLPEQHKLRDEKMLMTNKFIYGPDYVPPVLSTVSGNATDENSADPKIESQSANQELVDDKSTNENTTKLNNENVTGQSEKSVDLSEQSEKTVDLYKPSEKTVDLSMKTVSEDVKGGESDVKDKSETNKTSETELGTEVNSR